MIISQSKKGKKEEAKKKGPEPEMQATGRGGDLIDLAASHSFRLGRPY